MFSSIVRGVSLSRGGSSLSASPARGMLERDATIFPDPPVAGTDGSTDGSDKTGGNRTAAPKPPLKRS